MEGDYLGDGRRSEDNIKMDTEETGSRLTGQTRYSLPMKLQHIVINFLTIHLTANSCTTGVLESVLKEKAKQLEGDVEAVDPLRLISVTSADPTEFQFLLFIDSVFFFQWPNSP
jgi:hypothetical protein